MLYKVHIDNRNYDKWSWFDGFTLEHVEYDGNPSTLKIFTEDIIEVDEEGREKIVHSSVRQMRNMPGILVLNDKTYGSYKNKKLYKCIPDDKRFPVFLVSYNDKKNTSFNKNKINQYITFAFLEWKTEQKHPIGVITNILGPVDVLNNFYEYQLYCKSLYASIQDFTNDTMNAIKERTEQEFIELIFSKNENKIENRALTENEYHHKVFSIDPPKSQDIDDAMSIRVLNDSKCSYILSIYIANVAIWMDSLCLWNSFSERISTIYLPDRKRPMLPNILSNCLCSLIENSKRFAYCLDIHIENNKIKNMQLKNTLICVYKNYKYQEPDLLNDPNYNLIFKVVSELCKDRKYIQSIKDSYDLVSYLMIMINMKCAETMVHYQNGIYRSVTMNNIIDIPVSVPDDICKYIKIWNCSSGQYSTFHEKLGHILVMEGVDSYVHISSPIRRLVDLLNSIMLQINLNMYNFENGAIEFYNKWLERIDYINTTTRAIRKIQTNCTILDLITKNENLTNIVHEGYIFDKIKRNDGLFQYMVYLNNIKVLSRITTRNDIENYQKSNFKIFVFTEESSLKKKIRLQLL
jgi:exoribonuclease R